MTARIVIMVGVAASGLTATDASACDLDGYAMHARYSPFAAMMTRNPADRSRADQLIANALVNIAPMRTTATDQANSSSSDPQPDAQPSSSDTSASQSQGYGDSSSESRSSSDNEPEWNPQDGSPTEALSAGAMFR